MNTHGLTVYLNLSAEQLATRLEMSRAGKRPLIANKQGNELRQFIAEGLFAREAFYKQAKVSVSGSDEEILANIEKAVSDFYAE